MKAYILTEAAKLFLSPYGVITKGDVVEDVPESARHYFNECEVDGAEAAETSAEAPEVEAPVAITEIEQAPEGDVVEEVPEVEQKTVKTNGKKSNK